MDAHQRRLSAKAAMHQRGGAFVGPFAFDAENIEWTEARALREQHVDCPAPRRQRRGMALQQRTGRFSVVVMIVHVLVISASAGSSGLFQYS